MYKTGNYTPQAPNATAVNVLRSWLTAVGIRSSRSTVTGFDLAVRCQDGSELEVQVTKRQDETMPGAGIQVLAGDITGKKLQRALDAFWRVTDAAGYERQAPIDRGPEPAPNAQGNPRKLDYHDEPFLVTIRHTEFRRSPNPSSDCWRKYHKVLNQVVWNFLRMNVELCMRQGVEFDDVMSYARCCLVSFVARHEIPEDEVTCHDNERKATSYLQQRLYLDTSSSLRVILVKKERSVMPDPQTVAVGLFGNPRADIEISPEPLETDEDGDVIDNDFDINYFDRKCELDVSSPTKRRTSAAIKLQQLLDEMPHDEMIGVLWETMENEHCDSTTRREAGRQIKLHYQKCESCRLAGDAPVDEDEDLPGSDALGSAV